MSGLGNKEIMAKNIQYYMDKYGKSRQEMCEALGVKYTTFTDWVKGNSYPRIDKIELMANYFGISKADLVEDHNSKSDDQYYLNDETRQIAQEAFENPELRTLFKVARDIPPERLKAHIEFMKSLKEQERGYNDEGC
ncbi:MAG: helix-turn-helix domain-containing protein [Allisonella histaminiformans]|uniref:helix-turn-helix domain-containing protein n=1 Tax=Allisonella histaminiformans TaxID=209880 RepID=UPI0023531DB0|nr:helix-turn-helix transcriptional regulator [Allisonella histaminiformans]MCI6003818.1 helix-turn-helix domain-containing protein [Allisonella histaminiformans]